MHDAKSNLSRLVASVESGEIPEIEIARAGHVVARIVPPNPSKPREPGSWSGKIHIHADFDDLPEGISAPFRGEDL